MEKRSIERIIAPPTPHFVGDGFRVHNFIPHGGAVPMQRMSPLIMLDYNSKFHFPATERPRGVGVHPHRGFETVTIAYKGRVAHHDSAGGGGVIGEGDVQWMTAASGVLHKEYHEEAFSRRGGAFHMAQLWVNLPRADKMGAPRYQPLQAGEMGRVTLPDGAGEVRVVAGSYRGVGGPARTFSPIDLYDARLSAGGRARFDFPDGHTLAVLVMEGEVTFNGARAASDDFVLFRRDGERLEVEAAREARLLVLSGEPLREPIVQYGPFVMNSEAEIRQAFVDFSRGAFGTLED